MYELFILLFGFAIGAISLWLFHQFQKNTIDSTELNGLRKEIDELIRDGLLKKQLQKTKS